MRTGGISKDEAEPWQREATIAGVRFRLEHPGAPPSAQHDQWAEEKRSNGWVHRAVKDALFAAVVRALTDNM